MADAQITVIDGDQTQIVLAPGENPSVVASIPGPQGPAGAGVPLGGTTNQVLFKQSSTNYDTAWGAITSAMIGDLEIVNADVSASAAIAGTKISPNFGSQNVITTGTSTAASFIPTSSTVPTNGVYLPAANSVAISTNGTGRVFVDASGNVGIGAASYGYGEKLGVGGTIVTSDGTIVGRLTSAGGVAYWGTVTNHALAFQTNGGEKLRITSAGLVGVGTSTPTERFHTTGALRVTGAQTTAGTGIYLDQTAGVGNVSVYGPDNSTQGTFRIYTATANGGIGSAKLAIDSSGRVGVGTTSPAVALHVYGASSQIRVESSTGTDGNIRFINTSGSMSMGLSGAGGNTFLIYDNTNAALAYQYAGAASAGVHSWFTNNTERARIRADGMFEVKGAGTAGVSPAFSVSGSAPANSAQLDSQGRWLVGTSSWYTIPDNRFGLSWTSGQQIKTTDSGSFGGLAIISATSTVNERLADLSLNRQNGATDYAALSSGNSIGSVTFNGADGSKFVRAASITAFVDTGTVSGTSMPGRLAFATTADGAASPTERMRISNNGQNDVFGSSTYVHIARSAQASGFNYLYLGCYGATNVSNGTASYIVYTNGNVQNTNGSYTTISDVKLKENIVDAGSQWNDLKAIQIRNWNFKDETGYETHRQIGPIAQELETVCPGLVFETPDRDEDGNETGEVTKGVNQSVLYMKAVKALQEAMERIEQLESKVAALEAQ